MTPEQKLRKADLMFNKHKGEWAKIEVRELRLMYQDAYLELEKRLSSIERKIDVLLYYWQSMDSEGSTVITKKIVVDLQELKKEL